MSKKVKLDELEIKDIEKDIIYGDPEQEEEPEANSEPLGPAYELELDSSIALKSLEYRYKLDSNLYNSKYSGTVVSDIISAATADNIINGTDRIDAPHIDLIKRTHAYEAGELYMDSQYSYFNLTPTASGSYKDKNDVPAGKDVKVRTSLYNLPSEYEEVEYIQQGFTGGSLPLGIFWDNVHMQVKFDGYIYIPATTDTYFDNNTPLGSMPAANNKKYGTVQTQNFSNYEITITPGSVHSNYNGGWWAGIGPCFTWGTTNNMGPRRLCYVNLAPPANGFSVPYSTTESNAYSAFFGNGSSFQPPAGQKVHYIADTEYLTLDDDGNTVIKPTWYDASTSTALFGGNVCARRSGIQFYDSDGNPLLQHCVYAKTTASNAKVVFPSRRVLQDGSVVYDPLRQFGDTKDLYNSLLDAGVSIEGSTNFTNRYNFYGYTNSNLNNCEIIWGGKAFNNIVTNFKFPIENPTANNPNEQKILEIAAGIDNPKPLGYFYCQDGWEVSFFMSGQSYPRNPNSPATFSYSFENRTIPRKSRLYSRFKIWKDYELAGYYITCRRKSDGIYGVYNTVNRKFTCSRIDELKSLGLDVDGATAGIYSLDLTAGNIYNGPYYNNTVLTVNRPVDVQNIYGKTDALSNWEYWNLCLMGPRYTDTYSENTYKVSLKISDPSISSDGLYFSYNHPEKRSDTVINFNVYIDGYNEDVMQGMKIQVKYKNNSERNRYRNTSTNIDTRTTIAGTEWRDISTAGDLTNFSVSIALSDSIYSNLSIAAPIQFRIDTSETLGAVDVDVQIETSSITIPYTKTENVKDNYGTLVIQPYDSMTEPLLFLWPNEYAKINSFYHTLDGVIYEKWLLNNLNYSDFLGTFKPSVNGTAYPWGFNSAYSYNRNIDLVCGDGIYFAFENNREYINVSDASAFYWPATTAFNLNENPLLIPNDEHWLPAAYCGQTWEIPVGKVDNNLNQERTWIAEIGNPVSQLTVIDEYTVGDYVEMLWGINKDDVINSVYSENPSGFLSFFHNNDTNNGLLTYLRNYISGDAWAHLPVYETAWNDSNDLTNSMIEFDWNLSKEPYNLNINDFLNIREHDMYVFENEDLNGVPPVPFLQWDMWNDIPYNLIDYIIESGLGLYNNYKTANMIPDDGDFVRANFRMFYLQENSYPDGGHPMESDRLWEEQLYHIYMHTTDVAPYRWGVFYQCGIMYPDAYLKVLPITLSFSVVHTGQDSTVQGDLNNAIEITLYSSYTPQNNILGDIIDIITLKWTSKNKVSTLGNPENYSLYSSIYKYTESNSGNVKTINSNDYETLIALKYTKAITVKSNINFVTSVNISGVNGNANKGWIVRELDPEMSMVSNDSWLLYYDSALDSHPTTAKTGVGFALNHAIVTLNV